MRALQEVQRVTVDISYTRCYISPVVWQAGIHVQLNVAKNCMFHMEVSVHIQLYIENVCQLILITKIISLFFSSPGEAGCPT